mgnify:CR=1 FL=1
MRPDLIDGVNFLIAGAADRHGEYLLVALRGIHHVEYAQWAYFDHAASEARLRHHSQYVEWIAIVGQSIACLVVYFAMDFDFPVGLCFVFIVASATLNFGLRYGTSGTFRLSDLEAVALSTEFQM